MKNKQTTLNLKASQAIASLGIECGSEKWWAEHKDFKKQKNGKMKIVPLGMKLGYFPQGHKAFIDTEHYPALNLQELLALLPAIGEKLGWGNDSYGYGYLGAESEAKKHAHNLLDTYLTNYDMEDVSAEIIRLVKE